LNSKIFTRLFCREASRRFGNDTKEEKLECISLCWSFSRASIILYIQLKLSRLAIDYQVLHVGSRGSVWIMSIVILSFDAQHYEFAPTN
jgi:hypothetical protein